MCVCMEKSIDVDFLLRNRDKLPVVAKLSHQPLRLEREFHIVQRLYRQPSGKDLLCKPLDKITLSHDGLIAFIYEDFCNNILEKFQPHNTPEFLNQQTLAAVDHRTMHHPPSADSFMSIQQFLDFAIQCCNCLEMIHKHQSIYLSDLKCISSTVFTNSTNYT